MTFKKLSPEEVRKHKGVSFTGVTTVFFCHDGKGHLFMAKRSDKARDEHGKWEFGSGGLKQGQSVLQSMRREVMEEYGVKPLKEEFIGYFDAFRETEKGSSHWLAMCFLVLVDPKKVRPSEPEMTTDHGWFKLDSLPTPQHSQIAVFMSLYGDKLKKMLAS